MRVPATTTSGSPALFASDRTASQRKTASASASPSPAAGAASSVDFSQAARTQFFNLTGSSSTSASKANAIKSFDEIVDDRTGKLAANLSARFVKEGILLDEPIKLEIDDLGQIRTDSPYKKKIEKLFEDNPELAKEFKDVAALNTMKAAQKALEAFDEETKAARSDEEKAIAYELYTARSMASQKVSGIMTLDDGKLRSASGEFMAKTLGEVPPVQASKKAEQVTGHRISLTV